MRQIDEKREAVSLRKQGHSLNEIVAKIGVVKSTASLWVRNIPLTEKGRKRLLTKIKLGQLVSAENKRQKTQDAINAHLAESLEELSGRSFDSFHKRLLCSLLYWCEGIKNHYHGVAFTNSDPKLVALFLKLFRGSFVVDERKFGACIHLHEYHNPRKQLLFWSRLTGIPAAQFTKPYLKPHTGKRIREDYPGCIQLRYYSNDIARQLLTTTQAFFSHMGD